MEELAKELRTDILEFLERFEQKSPEVILEERYAKFRKMGTTG